MSNGTMSDRGTDKSQDSQQKLINGGVQSPTTSPPNLQSRSTSSPSLNPRSCITCRKRKVRCDKKNPCNNCVKAGIECTFPGPGRAPRKPRKAQDNELLARLRRLEGVVQSLGATVDEKSPTATAVTSVSGANQRSADSPMSNLPVGSFIDADPQRKADKPVEKELGRLVIEEGRSRYVSNRIWASLGEEVAEMQEILDTDEESEDEDSPLPDQSGSGSGSSGSVHQSFIFGYSSAVGTLRNLHPTPTQIFVLWRVYKENVDPIVKIFHRPLLSKIFMGAAADVDSISKVHEAVLFAMYFAAITSLTPPQCKHLLGEDKDHLVNKFRFASEQAQARAGLLNTSSFMLLQSFVLFLLCVRRHDNTRFVWTMSGIALRIAVALGVHRDGTIFGLKPFETEMRRRLWWHICILDTRSSEEHGTDPSIFDQYYDTQLPLNINDEDLDPDMTEYPEAKEGCTEMTFCLIRFEVTVTFRRLTYIPPGRGICNLRANSVTLEDKEKLAESLQERIEERYLKHCDMSVPINWVSATVSRLILAKMWLVIHHPLQRDDRGKDMSQETRDRLFTTSTEVIEFSRLLESNENTAKWGWLFHTYMQWHAVVFILSELITRPPGPMVDRAWQAIDAVYDGWTSDAAGQRKGMLWRPMRILYAKAIAVRQQQMQKTVMPWNQQQLSQGPTASTAPQPNMNIAQKDMPYAANSVGAMDAIGQTALTFGMDLDSRELFRQNPQMNDFDFNTPIQPQPQDMTPAQRNLSDEEITEWLNTDQFNMPVTGPQSTAGWQGWDAMMTDFQTDTNDGALRPAIMNMTDWI